MLKLKKAFTAITIAVGFFLTLPLSAQTLSEQQIQEIVQKEVERLLNTDGTMDAAIEKGIANYINTQREAAERSKAKQQAEQAKNLRPVDAEVDHIFGKVDAPITLVEFSDFECPFCKRFHPVVKELLEKNPDTVRWVYRHFPLGFHNPGAQIQAEATECAAELGGNEAFWQYMGFLYVRTKSNGKGFPVADLKPLAEEIGLDGKAFEECMQSGRHTARVKKDIENGAKVGVTGTPAAFILNNKADVQFVAGALPLDRLQAIVDDLLEKAK